MHAMMRFEPRLHIDAETAGLIESTTMPLLESPTVIVTDAYPFPLAAEIVGDEVRVRAATGEKMTAILIVGDMPNLDDLEWLGDPALPTGHEIKCQETQNCEIRIDPACRLWTGEVILKSGHGTCGPSYVHALRRAPGRLPPFPYLSMTFITCRSCPVPVLADSHRILSRMASLNLSI
jgi:hypothetical protein